MLKDSLKKFNLVSYVIVFAAGCFLARISLNQRGKLTDLPQNIAIFKIKSIKTPKGIDKVRLSIAEECLVSRAVIKILSQQEDLVLAAPLKDMAELIQAINSQTGRLSLVSNDSKLQLCDKEPKVIYGVSF